MTTIRPNTLIAAARTMPRRLPRRSGLLAGLACAALCSAFSARAYTPQVYDSSKDTGQDFTAVPVNTAWNSSKGINQKIWSNIWGNSFWFSGSNGLWITSTQAAGWPSTGMMQMPTSCAAGFGYGDFHWRAALGAGNEGPGPNMIMWPADNDPGWPGIIANSDDNHIGEVDVFEINYGSNGTLYSTFHFYNGSVGGHNGQIMHTPDTFLAGNMTAMHDYDEVWGPGSLVLKIDGVVQMSAPPTQVRADYAHGGCNYTLGGQMAMQATGYDHTPSDWVEIAGMWWSATDQSAGSGTSTPISAPSPSPSPTPTPTPVSAAKLSVASASYNGKVTIGWSKSTGANDTVRWNLDGGYQGVVQDGVSDGTGKTASLSVSAAKTPSMTNGSTHTVQVYINEANGAVLSSNTMSFTVGGTSAPPPAPTPPAPTPPAPTPVPPGPTPTPSTGLSLTGIKIASSGGVTYAYLVGNKEVGGKATLRESIDGIYREVLWDNMPDGAFDFQSTMLPSGTHSLKLTLDGSSASVTATYTLSGGTVTLSN